MKQTPFYKFHIENGAKMIPFAGFNMPVEYTGINEEHITVREKVGVFDVSHMGEFWVKGPKAYDFVQKVTSNDISTLEIGQAQYSCLPNGKGGIVDDLLVYYYAMDKYLLVVNAANIEKDWNWLVSENSEGAELENVSDNIAQLAIQGPLSKYVLQKITKCELTDLKYYTFVVTELAGIKNILISATGYTGAGGFELYTDNKDAEKLWTAIFKAGKEFGIKPIGLAARDTLRLEMGFCLYGNDIDDTTSPIEAGLGWITKFTDENRFIDRDFLEKQKNAPIVRRLKGFEMIERGIPRHDYEIVDNQGNNIGTVTSGTMSPSLKKGIGMGYINAGFIKEGTEIYIRIRNKDIKARVVKLPFYKNNIS